MTTNLEASDLAVIDRQVNEAFPIWKRLNKNQYLFLLISLTITAALWFAGSAVAAEGSKLRAFSEPLHDFALFVFSLGIFDSIKEFFFKEDYEKQKKELLDIITTRFLREMDATKNIRSSGVRLIRESFDTSDLKKIILNLERGDTLYCHDGSISDFSRLKEAIKSKATDGVNFRFMSIAPFCKNAQRRGDELDEPREDYSSGCKKFVSIIENIQTELANQKAAGELSDSDCNERVKIKLYRSLMNIPFYLIVRNNKPTVAITGFYLRMLSSSAIHIEWHAQTNYNYSTSFEDPDDKEQIAEDSCFISSLWDYWRYKWSRGCEEYERAKRLEGKWKYKSFAEDESKVPIYEGECTIREEAGSLRAIGKRIKTRIKDGDGQWTDQFLITNIPWETEVMHKYVEAGKLCLITSHRCFPQEGVLATKGVTAFMQLTLNEESNGSMSREASNMLVGTFFVTGKQEDALFQARTGTIEFERQQPESMTM